MKKQLITIIGSGTLAVTLLVAGIGFADSDMDKIITGTIHVPSQSESDFPALTKITMGQAIQKALASASGKVLKAELKEEDGFLVYRVEIVTPDKTVMQIILDAGSGNVLLINKDKADHEYREDKDHEHGDHEENERD